MAKAENKNRRQRSAGTLRRSKKAELEELIADAIVDCYSESEEATGLFTAIEESIAFPFTATVLGMHVRVEEVDMDIRDVIVAVCSGDHGRQTIRLLDLILPEPPPAGAEWIEAYRLWYNRC